jgi:hypothetical protein
MWRCGGDEFLLTKANVKLNLVDRLFGISNQSIISKFKWCARWLLKASRVELFPSSKDQQRMEEITQGEKVWRIRKEYL